MNNIKSFPGIASLALRLVTGIKYLLLVIISFGSLSSILSQWILVVAMLVYLVGSLLLIGGLFVRWTAVGFIVFTLLTDIIYGQLNSFTAILNLLLDINLWVFVAIWLIGPGIYSLDAKLFKKNNAPAAPANNY